MQLTVSQAAHDHLRRAQELLRHLIPTGDPAAVVERALAVLVEQLERAKCAATPAPGRSSGGATTSRHIPAAVRREVWRRDEGRCAFVGARGRCAERGFLEFHHVTPFAVGGPNDGTNIQLRCRAHNRFEAELFFGADAVRERAPVWDDSVWTDSSVARSAPTGGRRQQHPAASATARAAGPQIRTVGVADKKPVGAQLVEQWLDPAAFDGPEARRLRRQQCHPWHLDVFRHDALFQWIAWRGPHA